MVTIYNIRMTIHPSIPYQRALLKRCYSGSIFVVFAIEESSHKRALL